MTRPKLSICIITCNRAKYLHKTPQGPRKLAIKETETLIPSFITPDSGSMPISVRPETVEGLASVCATGVSEV